MATHERKVEEGYEVVTCPMCHGHEAKPMFLKGPSKIVRCRSCCLVYASMRPRESAMTSIYSDKYFQERSRVSEEFLEGQRTLHDVMGEKILRRLGKPSPGDHLLDIGCGVGKFLLHAREYGWDVAGIEPSAYAAAYARESLGLNVQTGLFRAGEYPAALYRAVVLLDVIEHFYDPLAMLREIHQILQSDGCCALTTPNFRGLSTFLFGGDNYALDATLAGPGHVTFFSPATLRAMLRAVGFARIKLWTGEIYLKNFTDLLRRLFASRRSSAELHGQARRLLRPKWWTVALYHMVNWVLKTTRLGDQITVLAFKEKG